MLKQIILGAALALTTMGTAAWADPEPYAKRQYHLPSGGTQVTPAALAANPLRYYRSEAAYADARGRIGQVLGRRLTDQGFRNWITSNRAEVVDCNGQTLPFLAFDPETGRAHIRARACVAGERLVVAHLGLFGGREVVVMSLGCLNPVHYTEPQRQVIDSGGDGPSVGIPIPTPDQPDQPDQPDGCQGEDCVDPDVVTPPTGGCDRQNAGNAMCVGGSRYNGITGASGKNDANRGAPPAATMNGDRADVTGPQPGPDPTSPSGGTQAGGRPEHAGGGRPDHAGGGRPDHAGGPNH